MSNNGKSAQATKLVKQNKNPRPQSLPEHLGMVLDECVLPNCKATL